MASSYPAGYDAFTNPTASDSLASATVPHATQHANANDAIEAIQAELGLDPAGASATVRARLDTLDTTVAGKAASSHTHAQSDVTNLTTDLAAKAPSASPTFTGAALFADGTVSAPSIANDGDPNTGIYFPADNAIALATDGVARLSIDSAGLFTGTGTSLGAWTSYTPSWTASVTNPTVGNGAVVGAYCQVGKSVIVKVQITIGSTTNIGSGVYGVSIPVTSKTTSQFNYIADGLVYDASTGTNYPVRIQPNGTGSVYLCWTNANFNYVQHNSPVTFANGDIIAVQARYEAA